MTQTLHEVPQFKNDDEFRAVKTLIDKLVMEGQLRTCGLDPSEQTWFVEVYEDRNGGTWHLAIPDHALRGYLRKFSPPLAQR